MACLHGNSLYCSLCPPTATPGEPLPGDARLDRIEQKLDAILSLLEPLPCDVPAPHLHGLDAADEFPPLRRDQFATRLCYARSAEGEPISLLQPTEVTAVVTCPWCRDPQACTNPHEGCATRRRPFAEVAK